ncbi:MAG TPA: carboxymuconolactone decarboxylase family protein [Gammaproteobacteria bacterium]|nr:carboxymuconolactone decarboxylase family protein [Gammaproteobacteria bacterium]
MDRLPPIPPERQTAAQRAAVAEIEAGPRGAVVGPFVAALRSPEFMCRLQKLGEYLRFENALGPRLTELAVLVVARHFTAEFEWVMHAPLAAERGIAPDAIDAIAAGRRPAALAEDEEAVFDFVSELLRAQAVSDQIYERAVSVFGEAGVIDLVGAVGYYSMLAMILSVAQTPLPPGKAPVLRPSGSKR